MKSTPRLIDQLASLTAIRDLELIEACLLKTLNGALALRGSRLIRLNGRGLPMMEIVYGAERCKINNANLILSSEMQRADECLRTSDIPHYSTKGEKGVVSVFTLISNRNGRSYLQILTDAELSKNDQHLMTGVLQIYRNFFNLMQHAQIDQLTGLANRKTFDDCVAKVHELIPAEVEVIAHGRRALQSMAFWLVMIDIDHFKLINDRLGHLYGDEVLILLAQLMKAAFRSDDMIFRFGGEEFVLILHCKDIDACRATLERFREKVAQCQIPQVGNVTISLGVTRMVRETFSATLLDYADKALYHSKQNGRNRLTFFEDMLAQGLASIAEIKTGDFSFLSS